VGFYNRYVLPLGIHLACRGKPIARQRSKVVPFARGRVLEVGIGSGLNLPFYDPGKVDKVWGLDPSAELRTFAEKAARKVGFEVEFLGLPGEEIPLDDGSVDTVVVTYTLCTIPEAGAALRQMRRVLKPGAELLFCEHGAAPDDNVRRWQDRLDPIWSRIGGGCHLNRPIVDLIHQAGFRIERVESGYIPGPKTHTFNYWGMARPD